MGNSSDENSASGDALKWLDLGTAEIERQKSRLLDAKSVMNTTVMIECRDQIQDVCATGESFLKRRRDLERVRFAFPEVQGLPPPPNYLSPHGEHEGASEQDVTVKISIVITDARQWLRDHLPSEYWEGFGDASGDSRDPVPATPFPGGLGARAAVNPSQLLPMTTRFPRFGERRE